MARIKANAADLITRLTTIDAAAERKFNATSQEMVSRRTRELRRLIANGTPLTDIYPVVIDMRGWSCVGSFASITWLDTQLDRLAEYLEPESVALANHEAAAHITNDLIEANR